ncbi:hypothetical protein H2199_001159 [Coniosporium tulheliwenetii]|uniref:Uncharacterized protein n=1 Tax=Coniosporium tulheliwenetii TaxID=3383036 RepID=A0ACC2ZL53_9PEZI|nr:hypothetical protein H2199_001159 [Cladosporium sp. JES 115]
MIKLTYLSAGLIAAAMNLLSAAYASPADLTATMDAKAEPTGLNRNLVEVNAVIHAFTDLGGHRAVFTLFPGEFTAYKRNFDGTCNCTTSPFELEREDMRYDVQAYPCIKGEY